jgi:hypothetical protein
MASVGVGLNAQLGAVFWMLTKRLAVEYAALVNLPKFIQTLAEIACG